MKSNFSLQKPDTMETDIVLVETGCCGQYDVTLKKNSFKIHKQDIPMSTVRIPF
jgi:hypothetical protein